MGFAVGAGSDIESVRGSRGYFSLVSWLAHRDFVDVDGGDVVSTDDGSCERGDGNSARLSVERKRSSVDLDILLDGVSDIFSNRKKNRKKEI